MAALRFCEICKAEIEAERAEHAPDTRLCGAHAREIEKFGGEFVTIATQERTSKPGSLKRNYGGVSTTRRRNLEAIEKLKDEYGNRWPEIRRVNASARRSLLQPPPVLVDAQRRVPLVLLIHGVHLLN